MALQAPPPDVMPAQTLPVARAAFPNGNPDMRRRGALGPIDTTSTGAARFSPTGRPAEAPAQRALITMMPLAAGLSAAQAADAVRARLDGKYALALELTAPGVEASVLSECRPRLIAGNAARLLFETVLTRWREPRLLNAKGRQRPDAPHVLAAIQTLTRLEGVGATPRPALPVRATAAPDGLQSWVPAVGCDRSSRRFADDRRPPERPARCALAEHMGTAGRHWPGALDEPATPAWRRQLPALQPLRHVGRPQC